MSDILIVGNKWNAKEVAKVVQVLQKKNRLRGMQRAELKHQASPLGVCIVFVLSMDIGHK